MIAKYPEIGEGTFIRWRGAWELDTEFEYGDLTTNDNAAWYCIKPHDSAVGNEPTVAGIGGAQDEFWDVFIPGVVGLTGSIENWHPSYQIDHHYNVHDLCSEAESGYGLSLWHCDTEHDGAVGKNPTGASGSSYWTKVVGGGQNGVSSLAAALDSLTEVTDEPVGDIDFIPIKRGGTWGKIKPNNYAKGYVVHIIKSAALVLDPVTPCGEPTAYNTPTNHVAGKACAFAHTEKQYAHFDYTLPFSYSGGALKAYMTLFSDGATSNTFTMGIQAFCLGDGDTMDGSYGAAVEVTDACQGEAYKNLKTAILDNIVPAGSPAGGKDVQFRIYRDHTNGTLAASIHLKTIMLLVPVNLKSEA